MHRQLQQCGIVWAHWPKQKTKNYEKKQVKKRCWTETVQFLVPNSQLLKHVKKSRALPRRKNWTPNYSQIQSNSRSITFQNEVIEIKIKLRMNSPWARRRRWLTFRVRRSCWSRGSRLLHGAVRSSPPFHRGRSDQLWLTHLRCESLPPKRINPCQFQITNSNKSTV